MTALIKNQSLQSDEWTINTEAESINDLNAEEKTLVSLAFWAANKDQLTGKPGLGLFLNSDDEVENIGEGLAGLEVIAINFPKFGDGRGYTAARLLRERYGYTGEIRAVGDVLQDQLFYMSRCGFDAFIVRSDRDAEQAINGLKAFTEVYQDAADQRQPLFRRR